MMFYEQCTAFLLSIYRDIHDDVISYRPHTHCQLALSVDRSRRFAWMEEEVLEGRVAVWVEVRSFLSSSFLFAFFFFPPVIRPGPRAKLHRAVEHLTLEHPRERHPRRDRRTPLTLQLG